MKDAGSGEPCGAPEKVLGSCRKTDGHTFCCLPSPRFKLKVTRLLLGAGGVPWLMLAAGGESLPGIVELRAAPCSRHASESVAARMLYRLPGPWPAAFRERQVQAASEDAERNWVPLKGPLPPAQAGMLSADLSHQ